MSINCQSTLYPNDNVLCSHGEDNWGGQLGPYDWLWDHLQDGDTEIRYFLLEKEKKKKKENPNSICMFTQRISGKHILETGDGAALGGVELMPPEWERWKLYYLSFCAILFL